MGFDAHKNFAYSTIAVAPIPAATGLALVLQAGGGKEMPVAPFNATVWPAGAPLALASNAEIVRVESVAGDALALSGRGQEGSSARSILAGDQFAATITVKTLTDIENAASSGTTYIFTQGIPSTKWIIAHNLKRYPVPFIQDSANSVVEGDVEYVNSNELVLTFSSAFSGIAYLN